MNEKKSMNISLSTFLLILALIAILVMGGFIFKLKNDNSAEIQKSTELQSQVNTLGETVTDLQKTINSISNTINSSKTEKSSNNTTINEATTSEKNTNNASTNTENSATSANASKKNTSASIADKIIGNWHAIDAIDANGNPGVLMYIYGTGLHYSNNMEFKRNGLFQYAIGLIPGDGHGDYSISGYTINCHAQTSDSGELESMTFTYFPEEDVLKTTIDYGEGPQTVIFKKAY